MMKPRSVRCLLAAVCLAAGGLVPLAPVAFAATPAPAPGVLRQIQRGPTTNLAAVAGTPNTAPAVQRHPVTGTSTGTSQASSRGDERLPKPSSPARRGTPNAATTVDGNVSDVAVNVDGINVVRDAAALAGETFENDTPDATMCVGNGFVLQPVNLALQVFDTSGHPLTGVADEHAFNGYPQYVNPTTGGQSAVFMSDVRCAYDQSTNRWFHTIFSIDHRASPQGRGYMNLAVSQTGDPRGNWNIYRIDTSNDGLYGTATHPQCVAPARPCFADETQIGLDANGVYLTGDETSDTTFDAEILALPKRALAAGQASVNAVQYFTDPGYGWTVDGVLGHRLKPALSGGADFDQSAGGTEYIVGSLFYGDTEATHTRLGMWTLTNTRSLDAATPSLVMHTNAVRINAYDVPPASSQKAGVFPAGMCLSDAACLQQFLGLPFPVPPLGPLSELPIDSGEAIVYSAFYSHHVLWTSTGTSVTVNGQVKSGVAWQALLPWATNSGVGAVLLQQGTLAVPNNNLAYPAIASPDGIHAVMTVTLTGDDYFPSAAYSRINLGSGASPLHVYAAGQAPYEKLAAETNPSQVRYRWGDYGNAVVVGDSVWVANEYIGNTCSMADWVATASLADQSAGVPVCGGTRTATENWNTRLAKITS